MREVVKHCSLNRYDRDERNQYFNMLDGKYSADKDTFVENVTVLTKGFPDLSIYQAVAYTFVWLCTQERGFAFEQVSEEDAQ